MCGRRVRLEVGNFGCIDRAQAVPQPPRRSLSMNRKDTLFRNLLRVGLAMLLALVAGPLARPLFAQGEAGRRPGGEANLIIPDLSSVSFFGIPGHTLLMGGLVVCALGLL